MKMKNLILFVISVFCIQFTFAETLKLPEIETQWKGGRVAFLGDSITDKIHVGTTKNYWQYLSESMGFDAFVYGINGNNFKGVLTQAHKLKAEHSADVDAIIVFCGTNDYFGGTPLGEWYKDSKAETQVAGEKVETRKCRGMNVDPNTFRGRINLVMKFLKENYPQSQIIFLTPIHRSFAKFSKDNVQPDESFPNRIGLYIDEYVDAIKEVSNVWAVSVIDLNAICGLYPNMPAYYDCFANEKTDRLHPNAKGHYRIAKALMYALQAYPLNFK